MASSEKRVLISGASKGIGLALAHHLSAEGYGLVLIASTEASIQALRVSSLGQGTRHQIYQVDVRDRRAVNAFAHDGPQLWAIVNNAGICKALNLGDDGDDPFDEVLNTNLLGPYHLTKALLPKLSRPGRIVNIGSQLAVEGRAGYGAYCASKFGLLGLTKCWAKELGAEGVTVNAVCPGWVDTEMSRVDLQRLASERGIGTKQLYEEICAPLELKRFNSTTEVASLVSYLLSESAAGISGRDWLMQTVWNQQ